MVTQKQADAAARQVAIEREAGINSTAATYTPPAPVAAPTAPAPTPAPTSPTPSSSPSTTTTAASTTTPTTSSAPTGDAGFDAINNLQAFGDTAAGQEMMNTINTLNNKIASGTLSPEEAASVQAQADATKAQYDQLIAEAERQKEQGMAKNLIAAGERGGLMSTQFAGIAALTPTVGGNFIGAGGELNRIQSEYDLNISSIKARQIQAVTDAQTAAKEAIRTGRIDDLNTAIQTFEMAKSLQEDHNNMVREKVEALAAYQERQLAFQQYQRETASGTIDAMVSAGLDPSTIPEESFAAIDQQGGYIAGTARGLMEVAISEAAAKSEADYIKNFGDVIDLTAKLKPDQFVDFNGNRYWGSKNGNIYEGYEVDKATGNITSIFRNEVTGEMTYTTQEGVLEPNVEYTKEWIDNGDGTESLWYVSEDPKFPPVPVNPNAGSGDGGVDSGVIQETFPEGMSYANGGAEAGMSEKDFWCLRWGGNLDTRGDSLINEVGDSIASKRASVETDIGFSEGARPPQKGDYILTNEDPTWGHFAIINDIRTDPKTGKKIAVISESNYKKGTVTHTRTMVLDSSNLEANGGRILGFKHSELKPEYSSQYGGDEQPSGATSFTRPTEAAIEAEEEANKPLTPSEQASLRKEIQSDKTIVNYNDLDATYNSMNSIANVALNPPAGTKKKDVKQGLASLDQALITMFNKMLDPTSVVREGEYARSMEGQDLISRAEGLKNNLLKGGAKITDDTRRDMVQVAKTLLDVAKTDYDETVNFYLPTLENYGLDPAMYIKGYRSGAFTSTGADASLKTQYPQYSSQIDTWLSQGKSIEAITAVLNSLAE